ncbi:hypothetical protein [Novosphingobium sp.]|uniref:hypothetical protein n=1 Tax=Novosphingobium sp. TaxID=1874826 RepID=UPI0025D5047B|nr:hypothetical protein [Novosphingobium sp.]
MVTYEFNFLGFDRNALSEEIIRSAENVLSCSGFSASEIGELFQSAAQKILSVAVSEKKLCAIFDDPKDEYQTQSIWEIIENFEYLRSVKALGRLRKRADVIGHLDDPAALTQAVIIIIEAINLRKEAFKWLKEEAEKYKLQVVSSHDQWAQLASDEELDKEEEVVFLDDYRWDGGFNWHEISHIVEALARSGQRENLEKFSELVLDELLAFQSRIKDDVKNAVGHVGQYENFASFVKRHADVGELAQAELLDKFIRESGFSGGTSSLEYWLEGMARRNEVERYKRSNRWRIVVRQGIIG